MNDEYKGYRITAWPERDDTTGLWNAASAFSLAMAKLHTRVLLSRWMMKTRRMRPQAQRPARGSMSNSCSAH